MKTIILLLNALFLSLHCFAQNNNTSSPVSFKPITNENAADALKMLDIDIFNVQFPLIHQKEFQLIVYLEEYVSGAIRSSQEVFSRNYKSSIQKQDQLSIIIRKVNDTLLSTAIKTSRGQNIIPIKKDIKFNLPYEAKQFKEQMLSPGTKIPLILYGSMWHDPEIPIGAVRFCLEKELNPNFSSDAFKMMPHYYIFFMEIK
jgi:hypothetical protein